MNTLDAKKTSETKIEAVRGILKALDKSFTKDGILLARVLFKRDDQGNLTELLLSYEEAEHNE